MLFKCVCHFYIRHPNSTGPLSGTTKNLHLITLSLCLNLTVQISNCSVFELLQAFKTTFFCSMQVVPLLILGYKFLEL